MSKLYILDLDILKSLLKPRFSTTGKPSNQQPEISRSFILTSELHFSNISKWIEFLKATPILSYAVGGSPSNIPGVGSHYDFITRLWLENYDVEQERQNSLHPFKKKPRKKFGKNRWSWWTTLHSTNIHLDARIKVSKFNFISILEKLALQVAQFK
ncbi:hypothetical protein [Clostridium estertheticum]|uniref:Uncharacterized protein n=1 Tax=Clostridium estertheticum subsp. estertheticum TaxID=1552 RepID=A0A1J0GJV4_9CLOT|nr:hypothetical protein [Clostridium estertheticum]APC41617.1 hypothetical protein A7L45_16810 [Clostridium estertheticum subsp. estertheticum]MBU3076092.1 hypothetical protein [Clostridium estertheticum]MBU3166184.1 hypothetical protein [Clostridium estertheticum]WAG72242.1 hypothetical protein LL032_13800 [Clostridium estertheticum]